MNTAFPTRAATAFSSGRSIALGGGRSLFLRNFSLARIAALHSLESPLFYPEPRLGVGLGWIATLRTLCEEDDMTPAERLARGGIPAFAVESLEWAQAQGLAFDDVVSAAVAIKEQWRELCDLDRAEKDGRVTVTNAGEASRPAMDTSRNSPAIASAPGIGA